MTPSEMEAQRKMMREVLRDELKPLETKIDAHGKKLDSHDAKFSALGDRMGKQESATRALQETDQKHSGMHQDLKAGIRQSQSEIKTEVAGTVEGVKRHEEQVTLTLGDMVNRLDRIEKQGTSIAPAAEKAEKAANLAVGTTQAVQVAANRADTFSLSAKKRALAATIASVALFIFEIIKLLVQSGGHS